MTATPLPIAHRCSGVAALPGQGAAARRLAATLAGGVAGLVVGLTLAAIGPDSRVAGRGVAAQGPVSRDTSSRLGSIPNGSPVGDGAPTSVAPAITPAMGLPVRDARESGGGRR